MDRAKVKLAAGQLVGLTSMEGVGDKEIERKVVEIIGELNRCSKCDRPLMVLQHLTIYHDNLCWMCAGK